jgi:hypothetical protein
MIGQCANRGTTHADRSRTLTRLSHQSRCGYVPAGQIVHDSLRLMKPTSRDAIVLVDESGQQLRDQKYRPILVARPHIFDISQGVGGVITKLPAVLLRQWGRTGFPYGVRLGLDGRHSALRIEHNASGRTQMRHLPAPAAALVLEIALHLKPRIDEHLYFDAGHHNVPPSALRSPDHHHDIEIAVGIPFAAQSRTARQHTDKIGAKIRAKSSHYKLHDRQVVHPQVPRDCLHLAHYAATWASGHFPPAALRGGGSCSQKPAAAEGRHGVLRRVVYSGLVAMFFACDR